MPFLKILPATPTQQRSNDSDIPSHDELPIILIPGILGNAHECMELARQLHAKSKNLRAIYVYHHPILEGGETDLSVEEQVNLIAAEILKIQPKDTPYLICGYSFGCTLAALVAAKLNKPYQDHFLYLIDGATPTETTRYLTEHSRASILDIIKIINYAATLCGLDIMEKPTETFIQRLTTLTYEETIDEIKNALKEINTQSDEDNIGNFETVVKIAKHNFETIPPTNTTLALKNITALITTATKSKYGLDDCGWKKETTSQPYYIDDKKLSITEHTQLLNTGNAEKIATHITKHITTVVKNELTDNEVKARKFQRMADELSSIQSSPEVEQARALLLLASQKFGKQIIPTPEELETGDKGSTLHRFFKKDPAQQVKPAEQSQVRSFMLGQ